MDQGVQPLNANGIATLLQFGQFAARLPGPPRNRSQVYRYIERIYRVPDNEEVVNWFRCSWCRQILYCITRNGTTTLIRHLERCTARPNGVVDFQRQIAIQPPDVGPAQNANIPQNAAVSADSLVNVQPQNVSTAQNANIPQNAVVGADGLVNVGTAQNANIPQNAVVGADGLVNVQPQNVGTAQNANIPRNAVVRLISTSNDNSNISQNAAVPFAESNNVPNVSREPVSVVIPTPNAPNIATNNRSILTPSAVAEALAKATEIGKRFGTVTAIEFEAILPQPDEPWSLDFLENAEQLASSRVHLGEQNISSEQVNKTPLKRNSTSIDEGGPMTKKSRKEEAKAGTSSSNTSHSEIGVQNDSIPSLTESDSKPAQSKKTLLKRNSTSTGENEPMAKKVCESKVESVATSATSEKHSGAQKIDRSEATRKRKKIGSGASVVQLEKVRPKRAASDSAKLAISSTFQSYTKKR